MKVKLKDICTVNPKAPDLSDDLMVSFVPMPKVGEHGEFDPSDIKKCIDVKKGFTSFTNGDVLFAKITPCMENGKGAIARSLENGYGFGSTEFHVLRPDFNQVTSEWLYYLTRWSEFRRVAEKNMTGSAGQKRVPKSFLENFEVDLPELNEQKEKTNNLMHISKLIDNRKQQLAKLDELVKARFVEMFGDPVDNPYGWEQTTLKNIAIGKLSYGSGASACEYDGDIRYVRITDIDINGRLNDDIVSPNSVEEKYILNEGDILFARSGATVGKSYRYRESDGKCLYAGYLIRLVPNTEKVLPDYVFYYTKTSYYERFIASNMKIVAQPNINAQQYGDLTICIPPMELQKDFNTFVEQVDKSKFVVQQSLDKLETLKKSLMQKYFG